METMGENTQTQNGTEKRSIKKIQGLKDWHSEIVLGDEWSFEMTPSVRLMKVTGITENRDLAYLLRDSTLKVCRHYKSAIQVEKKPTKNAHKKCYVWGDKMEIVIFFISYSCLCILYLFLNFSLIYSGALIVWISS